MKKRLAKLSSFELNSSTYSERLAELEEAVQSVDTYRKQTNQSILDIQEELSAKPTLIETE
jgi:galactokinase